MRPLMAQEHMHQGELFVCLFPLPSASLLVWGLKANESHGCQQQKVRAADSCCSSTQKLSETECSGCWHMLWRQISAVCRLKCIIWTRLWAKHLQCLLKTSLMFKILWSSEIQPCSYFSLSERTRHTDTLGTRGSLFPLPPSRRDSLACFSWFTSWDESLQTNSSSREAAQRPLQEQKRSSLSLWAGFTVQRQGEGRRMIYVGPFIRESGVQIECGIFLWKTNKYWLYFPVWKNLVL